METVKLRPASQPWQEQLIRFTPYIASGLILIILPPFLPPYLQGLMTRVLIFAIFAMSLDLIFGYTGLLSLGHAAYFGVGGYTVGVLMLRFGITSFWIGAPLGILMAALIAAAFGIIALRVSGMYFLLVTFALGQLLSSAGWKWKWLSSAGTTGVVGIPRADLGLPWFTWNAISFYFFVLLIFALCFFILYRIVNSPFGYALKGIRESEPRMRALGYNIWLHKYIAFVVAGLLAGVAGVLFVYYNGVITPVHLAIGTSGPVMFMVIIGGAGTLYGPVIGAAVIILLEFYASIFTPERWPLILGGVFVISIMFARKGIGVYIARLWGKVIEHYGSAKD